MSEQSVKPYHYGLHGFSFATKKERQRVAEAHHLWPLFEAYYRKHWDDRKPDMNAFDDRNLYQFFIEGAMQQKLIDE